MNGRRPMPMRGPLGNSRISAGTPADMYTSAGHRAGIIDVEFGFKLKFTLVWDVPEQQKQQSSTLATNSHEMILGETFR